MTTPDPHGTAARDAAAGLLRASAQVRHARTTLARLIVTADAGLDDEHRDRQLLLEALLRDLTELLHDLAPDA
jgi:hypothetical protein